jgi:serine/threonine-protein kinase PknG
VFEDLSDPLDAGLGAPPDLESWTTRPAGDVFRPEICADGRPTPTTLAISLPPPRLDLQDPAAAFLTGVSTADPRRLLDELATFRRRSAEIELWRCRALLALGDYPEMRRILDELDGRDWRTAWHQGLLALATSVDDEGMLSVAKKMFTKVRAWLPGELAPLVALGCTEEYAGWPTAAESHYQCVWRTDATAVVAAFGLARVYLAAGDRDRAVEVLNDVPPRSQHYDRARIAAIRVRAGHFDNAGVPTPHDLGDVVTRLAPDNFVGVDGGRIRARLVTFVLQTVLDRIVTWPGQTDRLPAGPVLGDPVTERGVRLLLRDSFRELALKQAETEAQHNILTDLANAVRPWTWW